jgi:hypothetical protein
VLLLQTFIRGELDYSYGPSHVASINPVWDQEELEKILNEYNKVHSPILSLP